MPHHETQLVRFGPFELDVLCGQLRKDGLGLKLQGQPVQLLQILLEKPGQLVTRDEIRQRLWGNETFVDFDHSLNTAVKKLRQALGDDPETPRYIETLPKRGYRFIGQVNGVPASTPAVPALTVPAEPAVVSPSLESAAAPSLVKLPPRPPNRRARRLAGVLAVLLVIASAGYWAASPSPQPRIVGSHALTKTRNRKDFLDKHIVGRDSVHFLEQRPSGWSYLQVPAAGGDVSQAPFPAELNFAGEFDDELSPDRTRLLFVRHNLISGQDDLWEQTLSSGASRLLVKDACGSLWDSDGRSFFFLRCNLKDQVHELYHANPDGSGVTWITTQDYIGLPHLSPDGKHIRFTGNNGFYMREIGTDGSGLHGLFQDKSEAMGGTWSPDGKHYFFTSWDGQRWSLFSSPESQHWWSKGSSHRQQLTFGPLSIGIPAISDDGRELYAVGMDPHGELSIYDSNTRQFVPYLSGISACFVDFSPDGKWITYVSYPEGTLWRAKADGTEAVQLTEPPLAVLNPRWSADGKLIIFLDESNGDRKTMSLLGAHRIYSISPEGGGPQLLLSGYYGDPSWSPDGRSFVYYYGPTPSSTDRELRIFDLATQKSISVPESKDKWSPRWSPDGRYLIALQGDPANRLMLFSFTTKAWLELAANASFGWPTWSRDSKFVYSQRDDDMVKISISGSSTDVIGSMHGFQSTAYLMDRYSAGWLGFTPDGRPISTRDVGTSEMYAFDLDYK